MNLNLGDPEWELVDPTPNVHALFLHFDQVFFWTKLASRAVVRWSKRMYSCAGICSYDRVLCDIALSEPLLKLRPRKDLVETLLHEMIHAYLFITCRDRDRDGHGPNFKEHMYRINKAAGLNISIYHDFHEEVKLYQTHWWRCNGPCHNQKPYYGIVRRSINRAPGPSDYWWENHQRKCGGTFMKIKEPENFGKNKKKKASPKPTGDITKYVNNNNNVKNENVTKPVLKDFNNVPAKSKVITNTNSSGTIVVSKKNNIVFKPQNVNSTVVFSGKGHTVSDKIWTASADVFENVRKFWANYQLPTSAPNKTNQKPVLPQGNSISANSENSRKQKIENTDIPSPPAKIKKIDDYFKSTATALLKDLYGKDFEVKDNNNSSKRFSVVPINLDLVDCPVCNNKINREDINRHLDECLNKEIIENMSTETVDTKTITKIKLETCNDNNGIYSESIISSNKDVIATNIKKENITEVTPKTEFSNLNNSLVVNKVNDLGKLEDTKPKSDIPTIKIEPGSSKDILEPLIDQKCPCCGYVVTEPINEHLDECLAFFDNTTVPTEGASTSLFNEIIVIDDDDDMFDETQTLNATGTKTPCPCCLEMIEQDDMNNHLDLCLS